MQTPSTTRIIAEIRLALKRAHRAFGSWSKAGHEVLGIDPKHKGLAWLIAHGKRRPRPNQIAHYLEHFKPMLDALPDPRDVETVADAVYKQLQVGSGNAIPTRELARRLMVSLPRVRKGVALLRGARVLVLGGPRGLYLANGPEEVDHAIGVMQRRIAGMQRTADRLLYAKMATFPIALAPVAMPRAAALAQVQEDGD